MYLGRFKDNPTLKNRQLDVQESRYEKKTVRYSSVNFTIQKEQTESQISILSRIFSILPVKTQVVAARQNCQKTTTESTTTTAVEITTTTVTPTNNNNKSKRQKQFVNECRHKITIICAKRQQQQPENNQNNNNLNNNKII